MTKLRISAHRLEIERGRYNQTPVERRICPWCKLVLNNEIIEDETHFLQHCDLNAATRHKTHQKIISFASNRKISLPSSTTMTTIARNSNFLTLINNESKFQEHNTSEDQIHLHRIVAKFASMCISNRGKFIER